MTKHKAFNRKALDLLIILSCNFYAGTVQGMEAVKFISNEGVENSNSAEQFNTARMLAIGKGCKQDEKQAKTYFEQLVCNRSNIEICAWSYLWLTKLYLSNNSVKANEYLEKAAAYIKSTANLSSLGLLVKFFKTYDDTTLHLEAFTDTLQNATKHGYTKVVEFLLDDYKMPVNGNKLLQLAAQNGHKDMLELLLEKGAAIADIRDKTKCGQPVLELAVVNGHQEIVELLLDEEADIAELKGTTLIHSIIAYNSGNNKNPANQKVEKDMIAFLLDKAADINTIDNRNRTALHHAIRLRNDEVAVFLITKGADIRARDNRNQTPLHWAAGNGSIEVVKVLLDNGATIKDVRALNKNGSSVLKCAVTSGKKEMVELLLDKGGG